MGIIIGIDVGGSTTKIVGFDRSGNMINPLTVKANDPVASSYGAFGKFTSENGIEIKDIEKISMTGVGSTFTENGLFGIPTERISEFEAIGKLNAYQNRNRNATHSFACQHSVTSQFDACKNRKL